MYNHKTLTPCHHVTKNN